MQTRRFIYCALLAVLMFMLSCTSKPEAEPKTKNAYNSEQYRPQFHFTPDSMWMNDPNGMVYYEGEYHLFYQHHPHSTVWGPMHWGHAISTDLIHWEHLPIALYPDSLGAIFSGSAVIDWNNSSGLGTDKEPPMVAIFTHHNHELEKAGSDLFQYQSIAYSLDKGRNWTKFPGNPVLENPGIRDFRDPKVSWYEEGQKWLMVFAAQDRIMFYSSPNLIQWEKESEFSVELTPGEGVWECPDFFPLRFGEEEKWVLLVSIGDGGPNGGSGTKYFVGDFDGKLYTSDDPSGGFRWLDFGKDNYAGVTWSDIPAEDGRRIFMGWMSNWQYAQDVPTERWRSAMTLPRELILGKDGPGYVLSSVPLIETNQLRKEHIILDSGPFQIRKDIGPVIKEGYPLFEIDLLLELDPELEDIEFGFILESKDQEKLTVGFIGSKGVVSVDRSNAGQTSFSKHFPGIHTAPWKVSREGEIRVQAFIDLSSIELFVDHGEIVFSELIFPKAGFEKISLYTNHESVKLIKGDIYQLKSIW